MEGGHFYWDHVSPLKMFQLGSFPPELANKWRLGVGSIRRDQLTPRNSVFEFDKPGFGEKCKIFAAKAKRPILASTGQNHQPAMNYRAGSQSLYGQMQNMCRLFFYHRKALMFKLSYYIPHILRSLVVISVANLMVPYSGPFPNSFVILCL